jgi:twitching motility protein PilT
VYVHDKPFTHEYMKKILQETLPEDRFKQFEREKELDYSFGIAGVGRFRVNLFYQRTSIGAAIRALPFSPMSFEEIGFPGRVAEMLVSKPSGLILVTGPTGSGKTTTLAAMIDHINESNSCHIVTIEDPIEFLFRNKKAKVSQREVGSDTHSFNQALKHVLRQDPDVILIGEMRDLETIEIALTVAETGHLVFATLHTPDAVQSVNRIIDVFPAHQQQQVRVQLSFVLQSVISQQLLPKKGGGLCMAPEILIATPAIRNLIRESKSHQIYSSIQMGQKEGMRTLNMSLVELVKQGKVDKDEALYRSLDVGEFERLMNNKQ